MEQLNEIEALILLHLKLECIGIDREGRMFRIPGENPDDLPKVYIAAYFQPSGLTYFRAYQSGLPEDVYSRLNQFTDDVILHQHSIVHSVLESHYKCPGFHYGKSYIFPKTFPVPDYPDVCQISDLTEELIMRYDPKLMAVKTPVFAIVQEGQIVSSCQSSRENDQAGEAWVRTLPEYRGRGYACKVTAAWGYNLLSQSKVPFYSHKMENIASEAIARKLGLVQFITDAAYE